MKNLLTIVIPTYNRASFLELTLSNLYENSQNVNFDLLVCNNGSTDDTVNVIKRWENRLPNLKVLTHPKNVFYDRNIASGYRNFTTEYCMLMGDSYHISSEGLSNILKTLEEEHPTGIIINRPNPHLQLPYKIYNDINVLVEEIGWHITLLSCTILHKDFICEDRMKRYYDTGFEHLGVFLDYLAYKKDFRVVFMPEVTIELYNGMEKGVTSWKRTPFLVFGKRWFQFVMSLPNSISLESKIACLAKHDAEMNVFAPFYLAKLKIKGFTNFKDYRESRKFLPFVTNHALFIYDIIDLIVPSLPRLYQIAKKIKVKTMSHPVSYKRDCAV